MAAFAAKFENRDAVMRRLSRVAPEANKEVALAQLEAGEDLAERIVQRAPVGATGRYRSSIYADRLSKVGGNGSLVGMRATKDPNAVGIYALFYWQFLEFGTRKMAAQPHIFPTYRAARKSIKRKIATAVRRALKKSKGV